MCNDFFHIFVGQSNNSQVAVIKGQNNINEDDNVPLLLQNQIPSGYEQEDNMDVSLRPDMSTRIWYGHAQRDGLV